MIKRRKIKKNYQSYKRIPIEKDEELKTEKIQNEEESEEEDKLLKLKTSRNLKLLQNIRLKKKGINADNINCETKVLEEDERENKLLEKQFTKNITEKEIEEVHIESFIRNNMKEFYEQVDNNTKIVQEPERDKQDIIKDLYKLSDHLRVKSSTNDSQEKLNCITGITEMPLPMEIKLKNIEETEKLKRKLLQKAKYMNKKLG
ncbi:conserved protein, unknown function [Plasmodium ovale]|uniref:Telomere length and silencing protein 1 n=2 Tax=Plasmodium ovale TaxID=36330 RepID=A0A1A8W0Q2_PLAOA|nr:conserved Plasmodium protein, unknown function [Plasmodium ovale curtisi]SBT01220.1 conserved Plasmodium protein, unknown function [Plasmodium ovale curtisi]SCP05600.1 conserved protein, unknown function [Plasmodium ovale]